VLRLKRKLELSLTTPTNEKAEAGEGVNKTGLSTNLIQTGKQR
jgi:hypothetical protein